MQKCAILSGVRLGGGIGAANMKIEPQNLEEKLIWYTIIGTYGLYFIGAQFVWVPILAYFLGFRVFKKLWEQTEYTPVEERITVPISVWLWIIAAIAVEISLILAHIDFDLGWSKMIFTTVNSWARYWGLMALFPLIGCLKIRPQIIYRAICILCLQSLILTIVCYLVYFLKIPLPVYSTPFAIFKGPSSNYVVNLFVLGGDMGEDRQFRLQLFTNFANNLGLVGNVFFFITTQEANKKWRWLGMIGAAAMVVGSGSRSTIFSLAIAPILTWFLTNFSWPLQIAAGITSLVAGLIAPIVLDFIDTLWSKTIKGYRSSSAVVRKRLEEVALNRWTESPIWGHGFVAERGPKYTENMPIGSHNQWPDLLYIRGIIGFTAILVAMLWGTTDLLFKAQKSSIARTALSIYIVYWISTLAVDIEASAYLHWPGLILTGMAFNEKTATVLSPIKNYTIT